MAGDSDDLRLVLTLDSCLLPLLANLLGRLVPVHKRHVAVHKDEAVAVRVVLLDSLLDLVHGLLAIEHLIGALLEVLHAEHHEETLDDLTVELFVVDDEDLAVVVGLLVRARAFFSAKTHVRQRHNLG